MIRPGADEILASVIAAVENEIAPTVTDDYAASLCRTVAQLLRHVRVRHVEEATALLEDNTQLRELLRDIGTDSRFASIVAELPPAPEPSTPALADLETDARALRSALVAVIEMVPDEADPIRQRSRSHLGDQLRRQLPWQQDAYTGPRR